jgi:hypothetical protein
MPPQQGYRLPDFIDNVLRFRAHGWLFCPVLKWCPATEKARGVGAIHRDGTAACKAEWAG